MAETGQRSRADASMDLLNDIVRQPIDPDYAAVASRGGGRPRVRGRWDLALVALVIGVLFTVAAVETTRSAPALETERAELITRVQQAEAQQDALRVQAATLNAEIAQLRRDALGDDDQAKALTAELNALEPVTGASAVRGPGLVITVDDAAGDGTDSRDQVLDIDLQMLVNGLWESGAEAISINGHRLSNLTAIRSAGDAITVDYRSLNRPYRVEAIGNPRTLPARWVESSGGAWWNELAQNRRMRYEVSSVDEITLDADPGMTLRYARVKQ
ncbi:DUF881 domain-containing protein [Microlunatus ginsengisoli]|uniref:DUF881 domain-containing protein n=1 Tax=Microlunatus ginsengisoli TaxID=363863 RepID=A0ABP6ZBU9_9ACTN